MRIARGIIVALLLAATSSLHAATFTWSGGALLGSQWSRDNNWTTNAPPSNGTADLVFTGSDRLDAETDSAWSILSLTFNSAASNFSIQGNTLTIGSGGVSNNNNNFQTIQNDIILSAAQTWDTTSTGSLNFLGAVNTNTRLLTLTPNSAIGINGTVSGTGGVTINGTGDVVMSNSAANTYSGVTTVNAGFLLLGGEAFDANIVKIAGGLVIGGGTGNAHVNVLSNEQIGNTSAVTVNSGGLLRIAAITGISTETVGAVTINGGGVQISNGSFTASSLTMTGGNLGGLDSNFILGGNVTTLASAANANISSDTLNLNGVTRTFNVADGAVAADLQITSTIFNGGLIKTGAGTLRMSGGAFNSYTGSTTVNAGTLELFKTGNVNAIAGPLTVGVGGTVRLLAANQIVNTASVTIQGGVLDLNGFDEAIGGLTMEGGTVNTGTGTLTLGSNLVASVSGVVVPTINGNLNLGNVTRTFTVNDAPAAPIDLNVAAVVSSALSGNTNIIKDGAGTLLLGGANTYPGGLTVNAGEVAFGADTAAGSGTLTLNAGAVSAATNPRTLANTVTLGGDITIGGALDLTFSGPAFLTGDRILTISNTGLTTFAAIGQNASGRILTKTGAGTLVLSGANTYSGGTTVSQGKLISSGSLALSKDVLVADGAIFEVVNPQSLKVLNVASGGLAVLSSTTATFLTTNSLMLTGSAALDLNQRAMAVNYTPGQSPFTAVRSSIISGYAGGAWTGPGIRSSSAAANSALAIGYAEASEILGPAGGSFLGHNVDGDTVLVRTTLAGDANLDGTVGFADLVKVAQHYDNNTGNATWSIGDFSYDGNVGFADLVSVAQNYDAAFLPGPAIPGAAASFDHDVAAAFAEVPEPVALPFLLAACGLALGRTHRHPFGR